MTDTHATAIVEAPTATLEERQQVHPLVALAMASGEAPSPETLAKLMDLQERWEAGEARKAFARALTALKRDLPTVIGKDKIVDFKNKMGKRTYYTHTSLAGAMEAVTGPLTARGFSISWIPASGERDRVRVTCRLTHSEGHHEECSLTAPADTSGAKNPAQAIASTITLLERYTVLALLGIATADMADPTGEREAPADAIEPGRNRSAVRALIAAGISREEGEAHIGRPVSGWTRADRDRLQALLIAHEARGAEPADGELSAEEEARMDAELAERES